MFFRLTEYVTLTPPLVAKKTKVSAIESAQVLAQCKEIIDNCAAAIGMITWIRWSTSSKHWKLSGWSFAHYAIESCNDPADRIDTLSLNDTHITSTLSNCSGVAHRLHCCVKE